MALFPEERGGGWTRPTTVKRLCNRTTREATTPSRPVPAPTLKFMGREGRGGCPEEFEELCCWHHSSSPQYCLRGRVALSQAMHREEEGSWEGSSYSMDMKDHEDHIHLCHMWTRDSLNREKRIPFLHFYGRGHGHTGTSRGSRLWWRHLKSQVSWFDSSPSLGFKLEHYFVLSIRISLLM